MSNYLLLSVGILAFFIPYFLPDNLMLPDPNHFIIENKIAYKKLKKKQLQILGIYYTSVSLLQSLISLTLPITMILLFIFPVIMISQMEQRLVSKKVLSTKSNKISYLIEKCLA